jgi:hypothetical protein
MVIEDIRSKTANNKKYVYTSFELILPYGMLCGQ